MASTVRGPMRPPRQRLESIHRPRQLTPSRNSIARRTPVPIGRKDTPTCTNAACDKSEVTSEDGHLVCLNCGTVVRDDHITSEVTFGETSNGASVLQGSHLGADQSYTRLTAPGGSKITGGEDSRKAAERAAHRYIDGLCNGLKLSRLYLDNAMSYYKLALGANLVQGRDSRHVAVVCLYIASRGINESKIMLIDFCDILKVNVFKLGQTYSAIVKGLMLRQQGKIDAVNPENLIYRFAKQLEFGHETHRVAKEAVLILQRMDRDWILLGRRPAGVCGAALILAARMNNFRRSVREMTYVVKVSDVTIVERLAEFKKTAASQLSVSEFRNHGYNLATAHDPPAFYKPSAYEVGLKRFHRKKENLKRKETWTAADEGSPDDEGPGEVESDDVEHAAKKPRLEQSTSNTQEDADRLAMPPPPIPIDPNLTVSEQRLAEIAEEEVEANEQDETEPYNESLTLAENLRRRGRPPKTSKANPSPAATIKDINALVPGLDEILANTGDDIHGESSRGVLPTPPSTQSQEESALTITGPVSGDVTESTAPSSSSAVTTHFLITIRPAISDNPEISDSEFADDPEVTNCLLSTEESALKERIWLHENGEYLRLQEAKRIKQELAEANGTARVIVRRKRKKGNRLGDASNYHKVNEDGTVSGPTTPAEATEQMLKNRGFSRKINYLAVRKLYGDGGSRSRTGSVTSSRNGDEDDGAGVRSPSTGRSASTGRTQLALEVRRRPKANRASNSGSVPRDQRSPSDEANTTPLVPETDKEEPQEVEVIADGEDDEVEDDEGDYWDESDEHGEPPPQFGTTFGTVVDDVEDGKEEQEEGEEEDKDGVEDERRSKEDLDVIAEQYGDVDYEEID